MTGIQLFEAQIDDQLLPRATYDDLLTRHGFVDVGSTVLTPVHALTWGRRPASAPPRPPVPATSAPHDRRPGRRLLSADRAGGA